MLGWKPYVGNAKGILLPGDNLSPPTRWWSRWWSWLFHWRKVAVLRDATSNILGLRRGFRVGCRLPDGRTFLRTAQVLRSDRFRIRMRHESCAVFAITSDTGDEIPLTIVYVHTANENPYAWSILPPG